MIHDRHRLLDQFGWLLVLVLATIVGQSLIDTGETLIGSSVTHAISGAALLLAVRAAGVSRRWRRATDILVGVVVVSNVALVLLSHLLGAAADRPSEAGPELLWLAAAILVPVVVARRLLEHHVVTVQTILGAVATYLQIAVAYAFAYQALDVETAEDVFGAAVPTTSYMYVSLESITTLGLGDLAPVTELGRLAVVSEAVIGQVFLVTFVAMIVSRFDFGAGHRRLHSGDEKHDRAAPDDERPR